MKNLGLVVFGASTLTGCVLGGAACGYGLDILFDTDPWLTMISMLTGGVVGFLLMMKIFSTIRDS